MVDDVVSNETKMLLAVLPSLGETVDGEEDRAVNESTETVGIELHRVCLLRADRAGGKGETLRRPPL